jgi:signal transduction histidine kinase
MVPSFGEAAERNRYFASLIRAERSTILVAYLRSLEELGSPVIADPVARDQIMANAAEIITRVVASVQGCQVRIDDRQQSLSWMLGAFQAELTLADLLRAAATLLDVTVRTLSGAVEAHPRLMPCFSTAITVLNQCINRRIREATLAYADYLLDRVDKAYIDERRRIARDLHDRLGEGMSGALRQLELHELISQEDPLEADARAAMAKDAIAESMRRLRVITSDLRQPSVNGLEDALVRYIDSAADNRAAPEDVQLRVSGDETWAPRPVIEEVFLIVREAIRNALKHGPARTLVINITIAPHQLHARIDDDGRGFETRGPAERAGIGIVSMRERAALLGGRLAINSVPGQGTSVELLVPLPGAHQ